MSKKKVKKYQSPRLIKADRIAYFVLTVICGVIVPVALLCVFIFCQKQLIMSNSDIITFEASPAIFWCIVPLFIADISLLSPIAEAHSERKPIFGKKPPKPLIPQKKPWSSRHPLLLALIITLIFLLSLIPAFGGLLSRTELTETALRRYAMFGRQTESIPLSEASAIDAKIYFHAGKYGIRYELAYDINFMNGENYTFSSLSVSDAIKIRNLLKDVKMTVAGTNEFDRYCKDHHCTESQREELKNILLING